MGRAYEQIGQPPKQHWERAAYCAKRAIASSPLAREKFAHMAKIWLHLAVQLEERWALLDQCCCAKPAHGRSR